MKTDIYQSFDSCHKNTLRDAGSSPLINVEPIYNFDGGDLFADYENEFKFSNRKKNIENDSIIITNSSMGYTEDLLINEVLQFKKKRNANCAWM